MKFTIDRDDFIKALQRIQGIVEKRNTMPILANVLLEAKDGKLSTMATDLEVFIRDSAPARITEDGSLTVNARKLFEIVKELPPGEVDVSGGDDKITVKSGKIRFNVMGLAARDFPVFPTFDEAALKEIDREQLREMVDMTSFAVSTDETRYNINGFLLERDTGKFRMVATDGHRLALIEKPDGNAVAGEGKGSVLLPRKGVMEMRKLLEEKDEGGFLLGVTEKNAVMKKDDTEINIRLLEGEFPDYKKVIPQGNDKEVKAERTALLASLKRVSIVSLDKIKGVKFSFAPRGLTLSSSSPDFGEATEEVPVEYEGEEVEIAFNARYFIDMLEASEDERVRIRLKDSLSPAMVKPNGNEDYTYVIMPMRL